MESIVCTVIILCKVGLININFCMATIVIIVCNLLLKVLSAVKTIVLIRSFVAQILKVVNCLKECPSTLASYHYHTCYCNDSHIHSPV